MNTLLPKTDEFKQMIPPSARVPCLALTAAAKLLKQSVLSLNEEHRTDSGDIKSLGIALDYMQDR